MDILNNFHSKELVEKVILLTRIEKENQQEAIPGLFEICKTEDPGDQALFMADNTLRALLMKNEAQTNKGLLSESGKIRKICLQVIQRQHYLSAVPALLSLLSDAALRNENDIFDILSALSALKAPESLAIFRKNTRHADPMIAELSIEALGNMGDGASTPLLSGIVKASEASDNLKECDMTTVAAIESLGKIKSPEAIAFLTSAIHHKNPNTRRVIHEVLVGIGQEAVPEISSHFDQDDVDNKIMAANILGLIGGKKAGDTLISAIDKGASRHPNILFAIYEALGNIPSMKSIVCLSDGLKEKDEMILIAVISSIDKRVNPGVIDAIKTHLKAGNDHSKRLIKAIITSKALAIFESIHGDETVGSALIEAILHSNDTGGRTAFREKLKQMGSERALSDAAKLSAMAPPPSKRRILAVDDSKAMILFYQSTISEMGHGIETAMNGEEACQRIEAAGAYDLIITDMNMPVMNGIELCQKIRSQETTAQLPILMATTESERSQTEKAEKAGVTRFITKPFSAEALKKSIQEIIP